MNGKCSLGAMNGSIQFIGLVMLTCIVIIAAIYYFRDVNVKHIKILEKYEIGDDDAPIPIIPENQTSQITNRNYGSSHNAGTSVTDLPKYSNRKITSRECQVYFADEKTCDADTNNAKKCKYEFTDDWKEIKQVSDPLNPETLSFIPKKVYNQSYTRDDIANQKEMTACFKKVDNTNANNANRFVYNKNSLVNYGYGGAGQLISLNVDGTQGNYISMHFNNDITPATNYGRIIDSISSLERNTIPSITTAKKFLRLKLDDSNYITHFERVTINSTQTGFDIDSTFDVTNMIASGTNGKEYVGGIYGNTFRCFSITSQIPNSNVKIYRFNFNLLHNTPQVLSYSTHDAEVNIGGIINMDTLGQAPKEFNITTIGTLGNLGNLINKRYYDNTIKNFDNWSNPTNSNKPKTNRLTYINNDFDLMRAKRIEELDEELIIAANVPCRDYCKAESNLNDGVKEQSTYSIGKDDLLNLFTLDKGYAFYTSDVTQNDKVKAEDNNIRNERQIEVDGDTIDVEPTVTNAGNMRPVVIKGTDYKYFTFTNNGNNQNSYTINFTEPTMCDILVVGGGGAGGSGLGGGGGSGAVLFKSQITLNGNCSINVGKGGTGTTANANGENGQNSSVLISGITYTAVGGGGGGCRFNYDPYTGRPGNAGGSGGGGSFSNNGGTANVGGSSNKNTYSGWESYGNNGGEGKDTGDSPAPTHCSGGGGGAGSVGGITTPFGGGPGGAGKEFISYFGTGVGHNGWFAGGGGGQTFINAGVPAHANGGKGLFGGGGIGGFDGNPQVIAGNGLANTGGGGGGGLANGDYRGGDGGSGIVIIRYKIVRKVQKITKTEYFMTTNYQDVFDRIARGNNYTYTNSDNTGFVKNTISITQETNGINQSIVKNKNIIKNNIITAFVFLEVGYYRFKYELITYNIGKKGLKIVIFENVNGVPEATQKIELNSVGDTTFVSKGGFYKIAFCYSLYNDSDSPIDYNFTFNGKHSSTTSFEPVWDDSIKEYIPKWDNMIKYLYKDIRLYNVLLNNIISKTDSFLSNNYLFRKNGSIFNGYTSKPNPGYDVFSIIKENYLHSVLDKFKRKKYGNDMNDHLAEKTRIQAAYDPNKDGEIKYIDAVKKELNDFNCTAELGSRPTQLSLPKPATNFIITNVNYELPPDYITYSGITEKNRRTPADMQDATYRSFNIINNAAKTIYIDESSFGQRI